MLIVPPDVSPSAVGNSLVVMIGRIAMDDQTWFALFDSSKRQVKHEVDSLRQKIHPMRDARIEDLTRPVEKLEGM